MRASLTVKFTSRATPAIAEKRFPTWCRRRLRRGSSAGQDFGRAGGARAFLHDRDRRDQVAHRGSLSRVARHFQSERGGGGEAVAGAADIHWFFDTAGATPALAVFVYDERAFAAVRDDQRAQIGAAAPFGVVDAAEEAARGGFGLLLVGLDHRLAEQ